MARFAPPSAPGRSCFLLAGALALFVAAPSTVPAGDGRLDAVIGGRDFNAGVGVTATATSFMRGDGAGGFGPARTWGGGVDQRATLLADFNGDGQLDFCSANCVWSASVELRPGR